MYDSATSEPGVSPWPPIRVRCLRYTSIRQTRHKQMPARYWACKSYEQSRAAQLDTEKAHCVKLVWPTTPRHVRSAMCIGRATSALKANGQGALHEGSSSCNNRLSTHLSQVLRQGSPKGGRFPVKAEHGVAKVSSDSAQSCLEAEVMRLCMPRECQLDCSGL